VETVLESSSKTVVIGPDRPFCVIGERINPTGRKKFQAELQNGDLSRIEVDVAQQAPLADMLDVNVGDPLADEVELMRQAIPLVQSLTDLPLVIDSSVIEALEAGLSAYDGKALVNSVTGEDERLEAILPIVAKHGAAVIALANDDEIPMEPERRLEVAKKIVSRAGDHGIPPEDVVIDPLAMPVGAEPRAVTLFLETARLIRDELGVNMTCGASNTSFGLPGRETLGAGFLSIAASHGLTSAIMDARSQEIVEAVRATDFLLGHDEWGAAWIAAFRKKQAASGVGSTEPARSGAAGLAGGGSG
jgi:5-methyltetrahydrofolate--homocysteine methyltransferase